MWDRVYIYGLHFFTIIIIIFHIETFPKPTRQLSDNLVLWFSIMPYQESEQHWDSHTLDLDSQNYFRHPEGYDVKLKKSNNVVHM